MDDYYPARCPNITFYQSKVLQNGTCGALDCSVNFFVFFFLCVFFFFLGGAPRSSTGD